MGNESDPNGWFKGLAQYAGRIKLAPGVIGKSSLQNIALLLVWGVAFWRFDAEKPWSSVLLIGGLLVTAYIRSENQKMREFAIANPTLALMEGADITEHKKLEMEAAKGIPAIAHSVASLDPLNLSISAQRKENGPN